MRKVLCLVLCLMLLVPASAERILIGDLMEVVKCREFVTLRAEPDTKAEALDRVPLGAVVRTLGEYDEKFQRVLYGGQSGYVLSEYLAPAPTTAIAWKPVEVAEGSQEYANINLFLTNFTEQYFLNPAGYFDADTATDAELVQFAIAHICRNRPDDMEWGDWGEDGNVRLSDARIAEVCERFFGRAPESLQPVYMKYADGYYYWFDIGKIMSGGFAQASEIFRVGPDCYRVIFSVYGQEMFWDDSVYGMGEDVLAQEHPEYFSKYQPRGSAVFSAGDLLDRADWKLEWICMDWEV